MLREDLIRVRHMLDAAEAVRDFAQGRSRDDLENDRMFAFAVLRAVEVIGEAASKVTLKTRETHPQVPWQSIVGMRNRLIHAYFDVDLDRVWDTITLDIPALIPLLEDALVT